jgi:uncharacterized protein (DUF1778 family)
MARVPYKLETRNEAPATVKLTLREQMLIDSGARIAGTSRSAFLRSAGLGLARELSALADS